MLRDAGVRTKLLAVLAIPTVLLVVLTTLLVAGQVSEARRAAKVESLTEVAIQVNQVVHSLQRERSETLAHLGAPDAGTGDRVQGQRAHTDGQLRLLDELRADEAIAGTSAAIVAALARSEQGHRELAAARKSIDSGRFFASETDVFYGRIISADLDLPGVVAASGTADLSRSLQALQAMSMAIEFAAHERDLVEVGLLTGRMTESTYAQTVALVAQQRQALQDVQAKAPSALFSDLDDALAAAQNTEADQVRRGLTDLLVGKEPGYDAASGWVQAANSRISALTDAESVLVGSIAATAQDVYTSQSRKAIVLALAALLGLVLAGVLAVSLARRITRPLRRLTVSAGEIGAELPHMVERMQTPGQGPGVVVEPIPVESRDEIGQLAAAFNTVNDVTMEVAREQAALRASIAEMFVNVARRNQVLLGRQLAHLDRMESREEDPDVLDNLFKLDHLATRMRRNAESLLVLAGIDSTRKLRSPLPLSDVVRTAVGEIEAFDRIDLAMTEDPDVSGRHALTVAHLLAELLENATHFSNPETRVVVSAAVTRRGVELTVTDQGIGMTEPEVVAANESIARPPINDIAVSQRLGMFVVGRLARRLDASVALRRGRSAGTVASVALPSALFENMGVAAEVDSPAAGAPAALPATGAAYVPSIGHMAATTVATAAPGEDATPVLADAPTDDTIDDEKGARRPMRKFFGLVRRSRPAPAADSDDPTREPDAATEPAQYFAPAEPAQDIAPPAYVSPFAPVAAVAPVAPAAPAAPVAPAEPVEAPVEAPAAVAEAPVALETPVPTPEPARVWFSEHLPTPEPYTPTEPEPAAHTTAPASQPYQPSVDILPQRRGSRFGRHRQITPADGARPAPAPAHPVSLARPGQRRVDATVPGIAGPADLSSAGAPGTVGDPAGPALVGRTSPPDVDPLPTRAAEMDALALESQMHSSALSELRGLYEPAFTPAASPVPVPVTGLARRTPKAVADVDQAATAPSTPVRERNAAEVRGMLSGFRAGVARGRGVEIDTASIAAEHADQP